MSCKLRLPICGRSERIWLGKVEGWSILELKRIENAYAAGICFSLVNQRDHVSPLLRQFAARGAKSFGEH